MRGKKQEPREVAVTAAGFDTYTTEASGFTELHVYGTHPAAPKIVLGLTQEKTVALVTELAAALTFTGDPAAVGLGRRLEAVLWNDEPKILEASIEAVQPVININASFGATVNLGGAA